MNSFNWQGSKITVLRKCPVFLVTVLYVCLSTKPIPIRKVR